jgi:hypothetical protein
VREKVEVTITGIQVAMEEVQYGINWKMAAG